MRLLILVAFFVSAVKCMKLEISIKPLQDDGQAVGESACESEFFKEECSKGDKIYKTYANKTLGYCENECRLDIVCKAFFVHKYDCFLTKIPLANTGGTRTSVQLTSSLGIAGPVAKLMVPAQPVGVFKSSVGKDPPACHEFHFEECDERPNEEVEFEKKMNEIACMHECHAPMQDGDTTKCNSFGFEYNKALPKDQPRGCFTTEQNVMDFMRKKCKYKRGRVDLEAQDAGNFNSMEKCLKDEGLLCRRGDCKIDFLEAITDKERRTIDEITCQRECGGTTDYDEWTEKYFQCSHYRWTIPEITGAKGLCQLYYVKEDKNITGRKSPEYDCKWYAAESIYAQLIDVDHGDGNTTKKIKNEDKLNVCKAEGNAGNYVDVNVCTKKFRVKNAITGGPVTEATIKCHLEGTDKTGKTDLFGELKVNLTAEDRKDLNFMKIVVSKEGFDDQEIAEVSIEEGSCSEDVSISLNPKSKDGRIILTWDKNLPTDIDLHLIEFAQKQIDCRINHGQMTPDCSNNNLDIDNTRGGKYGPETITVKDLDKAKTYMVLAHKFSSENTGHFCRSGARVDVCVGNQGCKQHYSIPKKCFEKSEAWLVGCFKGTTGLGDMKVIDKLIANEVQQFPQLTPPSISECGY